MAFTRSPLLEIASESLIDRIEKFLNPLAIENQEAIKVTLKFKRDEIASDKADTPPQLSFRIRPSKPWLRLRQF